MTAKEAMVPVINLDYDDAVVQESEAQLLAKALQNIVAETTNIADVNVYASSALIKINALPIEIFIRMSARFVNDPVALTEAIRARLHAWKHEQNFPHPINIYLIPMQWIVASDI